MRRLSAEERAVWARVAGTIRPINLAHATAMSHALVASDPLTIEPGRVANDAAKQAAPSFRHAQSVTRPASVVQNSLDGSWDKRLRLGQIIPDYTIDLHGETLASAHARLNRSLAAAIRNEARIILLITGRPPRDNPRLPPTSRGVIRASVGDWLNASPYAANIAAIRNAHPRHGGAGALYLILRRAR
jgi:DNA-nicking Smr family endonuclease